MKAITSLTILFVLSSLASCENTREEYYEIHAHVLHLDGSAVEGANVSALRLVPKHTKPIVVATPDRTEVVQTDALGKAVLAFSSIPHPSGGVAIGKKGYYGSSYPNVTWVPIRNFEDGNWKTEIETILKPIKNPIPMYAYCNIGAMEKAVNIPEFDKEYGFDLQLADALPPLGRGKIADFFFKLTGSSSSDSEYDMILNIHFPGEYNGVVEFMTPERTGMREPVRSGSSLLSDHQAPADEYVSTITRRDTRPSVEIDPNNRNDVKRNFYFRTRSLVDNEGNLIQANYGKIYGDFYLIPARAGWGYLANFVVVTSYYNPTLNDRNVEFDPKQNLLPDGRVNQP